MKFADDTTLIGFISDGDDSVYREEIEHMVSWCSLKNLELNAKLILGGYPVNSVESFPFLKWELNITSLTKKSQQRMYFLWQLKKFNLPKTMLVHFYTAIIQSILTSSITVWYAAATVKDKGRLQRIIRSAERVIGCNLPSLCALHTSRSLRRAAKIEADPSHPGN